MNEGFEDVSEQYWFNVEHQSETRILNLSLLQLPPNFAQTYTLYRIFE